MRICTYSLGGEYRVGVLSGKKIADLELAYALSFVDLSPMEAMAHAEAQTPATCEEFLENLDACGTGGGAPPASSTEGRCFTIPPRCESSPRSSPGRSFAWRGTTPPTQPRWPR
jgi:hypothetical protein